MAREPPIMNEFHEVMMPHIPPTMMTFAMTEVLKASAIASAVTRPVPACEAVIAPEFMTRPTAMMTNA